MTGSESLDTRISDDDITRKIGDDMYFLNINKHRMEESSSKIKGYQYTYLLKTSS